MTFLEGLVKQIESMIKTLNEERKNEFLILATHNIEAIKQFKK